MHGDVSVLQATTADLLTWGCTGIKFAIEWPLHLLFEGEVPSRSYTITTHHWLQVLMQYNQLFGFLFLVRRVDAALHAAWAPQV